MKKTTVVLWCVYLGLLLVLLPHTAWLFNQFEPVGVLGMAAAWAGAFAFEGAIAVLTYKLARHIESAPRRLSAWRRFVHNYLNAYSAGLVISVAVSALANLAHAVQFGQVLTIFAAWGIPPALYQMAFGAVLPIVSLLFARVLSNVTESEAGIDPELETAKAQLSDARQALRQAERDRDAANARFAAAGDLLRLMADNKRERILAAHERWPQLTGAAIAIIAGSSPAHVSEVLGASDGTKARV